MGINLSDGRLRSIPGGSGSVFGRRPFGPIMSTVLLAVLAVIGAYKLMDMFPRNPFPERIGNYRLVKSTTVDGVFGLGPPVGAASVGKESVVRHMLAGYSAGEGLLEVRLLEIDLTAWSGDELLDSHIHGDVKPRNVVRKTEEGVQFTCHTGSRVATVCVWSTSDWTGSTITHSFTDLDGALEVAVAVQEKL